jgi:threonyl-tRNA synthetase
VLDFTLFVLKTFGFSHYDIYLSTQPEKFVGTPGNWERATNALKQALEAKGIAYAIDPGEGVFYGPKIDIKVKDSLNRPWQCSTIQVDFNNPERFDMSYRGSDGKEHRPIMIHRALMGSLERFFGILIEHYAGAFPVWLAPVQVDVLTIAERHAEYAKAFSDRLRSEGIKTELNSENEKIGYKIRNSTLRKVPYLIIIGDKEIAENAIMVRKRSGENIGPYTAEEFIDAEEDHEQESGVLTHGGVSTTKISGLNRPDQGKEVSWSMLGVSWVVSLHDALKVADDRGASTYWRWRQMLLPLSVKY